MASGNNYFYKDFKQSFVYREDLVKSYYEKLMILSAECKTKEQYARESLSLVNALFDKTDVEAKEYYAILKIRAEMLDGMRFSEHG